MGSVIFHILVRSKYCRVVVMQSKNTQGQNPTEQKQRFNKSGSKALGYKGEHVRSQAGLKPGF